MPLTETVPDMDMLAERRSEAAPSPPSAVQQALRRAARGSAGQAALRVRLSGAPEAAPRLVRHLLAEAARGGPVFSLGAGEWLLPEAEAAAAERAADGIETLLAGRAEALEVTRWRLPQDATALHALAEEAQEAPAVAPPATPTAAGLEATAAALDLAGILRRSPMLRVGGPGMIALGLLRLGIQSRPLAAALGPAGADPDLLRHARDRLARRLLAALADDAQRHALMGGEGTHRLLVELAADSLPAMDPPEDDEPATAKETPGMLAALPLAVAADPVLLARRRRALAADGWGLALRGIGADALSWIAPEALEVDLLLLRWSPELAGRAAGSALRRLDPAGLALIGCDDEEGLHWGLSLGIRLFGGAHPELVLAAARMAACPDRAACTRRQCLRRAAAGTASGRAGCTNPALLAAILPEGA